jgi:hypothetical protein
MYLATPVTVKGHVSLEDQWFFLPSLFPLSLPRKTDWPLKKINKSGYLFIESDQVFIFLITMYFVLNHLLSFFFSIYPLTFDFYIKFGSLLLLLLLLF